MMRGISHYCCIYVAQRLPEDRDNSILNASRVRQFMSEGPRKFGKLLYEMWIYMFISSPVSKEYEVKNMTNTKLQ